MKKNQYLVRVTLEAVVEADKLSSARKVCSLLAPRGSNHIKLPAGVTSLKQAPRLSQCVHIKRIIVDNKVKK